MREPSCPTSSMCGPIGMRLARLEADQAATIAAGMRIEPPPSLALAAGSTPAATAAAAPPDEPPGPRARSCGLQGRAVASGRWWRRRRARAYSSVRGDEACLGRPRRWESRSATACDPSALGHPGGDVRLRRPTDPSSTSARHGRDRRGASRSMPSPRRRWRWITALMSLSTASMRRMLDSSASAGDS